MKKCKKVPKELRGFGKVFEVEPVYSGIYFLYDYNELVYIGQSSDINQRIYIHIWEGKKRFTNAYYIPFRRTKIDAAEEYFIRMFKPKHNKSWGGKYKGTGKKPRIFEIK